VIDRRAVLLGAVRLLASPRAVDAQAVGKVYRVGLLSPAGPPRPATYDSRSDIVEVLREFGYVEGRNLTVDRRYADGRVERLGTLAAELIQKPVDVIVTFSPVAGRAARERTKTIPIVILFAGSDPVELGMVSNLARPGGNVTGVVLGSVLADKRLELLKEVIPDAKRIAMMIAGAYLSGNQVADAEQAAGRLGIRLVVVDAKDRDYERAFGAIRKQGADGLYVAPSPVLSTDRGRIIELAAKHRLPTIYQWVEHVEDGGLMAYGASLRWVTRRVAAYVDRIFKGAKPGDLPIEQATTLALALNLRTAKALGLTFPPSILTRAETIIE
jgi:putative ABC transport system substrate-binding protein